MNIFVSHLDTGGRGILDGGGGAGAGGVGVGGAGVGDALRLPGELAPSGDEFSQHRHVSMGVEPSLSALARRLGSLGVRLRARAAWRCSLTNLPRA